MRLYSIGTTNKYYSDSCDESTCDCSGWRGRSSIERRRRGRESSTNDRIGNSGGSDSDTNKSGVNSCNIRD